MILREVRRSHANNTRVPAARTEQHCTYLPYPSLPPYPQSSDQPLVPCSLLLCFFGP